MLLTENEMLFEWALRRHAVDLRYDAEITRPEGSPDIDIMLREMRDWYHKMLMTADTDILYVYDLSNSFYPAPTSTVGLYVIRLPEEFLRLVDLEIETSAGVRKVRIVDPDSRIGIFQRNPLTMAGPFTPVAYTPKPGKGNLNLFVNDRVAPKTFSFKAITLPPEGKYAVTEALLCLIPRL